MLLPWRWMLRPCSSQQFHSSSLNRKSDYPGAIRSRTRDASYSAERRFGNNQPPTVNLRKFILILFSVCTWYLARHSLPLRNGAATVSHGRGGDAAVQILNRAVLLKQEPHPHSVTVEYGDTMKAQGMAQESVGVAALRGKLSPSKEKLARRWCGGGAVVARRMRRLNVSDAARAQSDAARHLEDAAPVVVDAAMSGG
ncbi:hypothetical protein C8R47DRAFT_1084378 [Mycena vitilis]|nr:hypothetical protein C8R47DRAFT_1084378 [Mycena vitilis]